MENYLDEYPESDYGIAMQAESLPKKPVDPLPDSSPQDICNCKQCQAIRIALKFVEYITNPANPPLTESDFARMFPPQKWIGESIACALFEKYGVVCKDGLIRMR